MLLELYIENIALIKQLRLQLGKGFNVFTGETGAGKSILLDAMALVLGAKADSQLIRHGTEKALVEAVFSDPGVDVKQLMEQYGLDCTEELIISREISLKRSACRLNGRNFPLSVLREFGEKLVNIYGQHDFQTLMRPDNHVLLLDSVIPETQEVKLQLSKIAHEIAKTNKIIKDMAAQTQDALKEADFLEFQAKEIDEANLNEKEEEELIAKEKFLANAEKIISNLSNAYNVIYGNHAQSVSETLSQAVKNIQAIADCSEEIHDFNERINDLSALTDDLAIEIKSYLDAIDFNPNELEEVNARLFQIKALKKKYGGSISEILAYRSEVIKKLNLITYSSDNEAKLRETLQKLQLEYTQVASKLSGLRNKAAEQLTKEVSVALKDMNMSAQIKVVFSDQAGYSSHGQEIAEFHICTNAGEPYKPLSKIASGGELSRLMLAIRTVINKVDPVSTLVFDEVDAGMGGKTLTTVAEKLKNLAEDVQVLCVTHAAQLAAKANTHFLVQKEEKHEKTFTQVKTLNENERIQEIARMLDGQLTNTALIHASELLKMH